MQRSGSKKFLIGQIIAGVMSFLAISITAKYVGARIFGFCSLFILVLNIAITLVDFGGCSWASREYAAQKISLGTFKFVMWSKTKLNSLFILLTPVFLTDAMKEFQFAFLLLFFPMLWNRTNYIQQFLLVRNLSNTSVLLIIVDRACWLLIIPMSAVNADKILSFILPIIVGLLIQNIYFSVWIDTKENIEGEIVQYRQRSLFVISKHFGVIGTSGVISNFDGVLVASLSSISESSNYLLAQRFRNPLTIAFSSISMRLRPIAAKKNLKTIKAALRDDAQLMALSVISTTAFAIFLLFYAEKMLGPEFQDASVALFFGVITSIPLGILLLTSSLLGAMGVEDYVAKANTVYSITILIGVTFGTFFVGSLGAVLAGLFVTFMFALIFSNRLRRELEILL